MNLQITILKLSAARRGALEEIIQITQGCSASQNPLAAASQVYGAA